MDGLAGKGGNCRTNKAPAELCDEDHIPCDIHGACSYHANQRSDCILLRYQGCLHDVQRVQRLWRALDGLSQSGTRSASPNWVAGWAVVAVRPKCIKISSARYPVCVSLEDELEACTLVVSDCRPSRHQMAQSARSDTSSKVLSIQSIVTKRDGDEQSPGCNSLGVFAH